MHSPSMFGRAMPARCALLCALGLLGATPALAQITPAQKSALRANCRSDFMSKCSGVSPGGRDALMCLQKQVAALSPACQTAVRSTLPKPAAVKPQAQAPAAAPPPKPAAAAVTPPKAQPAAKSPTMITAEPKATVKRKVRHKMKTRHPITANTAPPLKLAAPPAPSAHRPRAPVLSAAVMLRACKRVMIRHCRGIRPGGGRELACLLAHYDSLTIRCRTAMRVTRPLH
jgi:hypothetical protein